MWIARGDTDDDDFITALEHAERISDPGDVDYLAGKGPLARYLPRGTGPDWSRMMYRLVLLVIIGFAVIGIFVGVIRAL